MYICSDKTATMVKSTTSAACPVHTILLKVLVRGRQLLINNGCTLVTFLTLCCSDKQLEGLERREDEEMSAYEFIYFMLVPLETKVRATADSVERNRRAMILYDAMKVMVRPL